jgi:AcrR family transcriptional regulator
MMSDVTLRSKNREMIKNAAIDLVRDLDLDHLTLSLLSKKAGIPVRTTKRLFKDNEEALSGSCLQCFSRLTAIIFKSGFENVLFKQGLKLVWLNYLQFEQQHAQEIVFINRFLQSPSTLYRKGIRSELTKLLRPFITYLNAYKKSAVSDVQALMIIALLGSYDRKYRKSFLNHLNETLLLERMFFSELWPDIEKILDLSSHKIL